MQVFAETGRRSDNWDDEPGGAGGFQLLNEVGSGGTLSSLFTILSLFTEDVRISWNEDNLTPRDEERDQGQNFESSNLRENEDVSRFDLTNSGANSTDSVPTLRRTSISSSGSTALPAANDAKFTMSPGQASSAIGVATPGSERSYARSEATTPGTASVLREGYGFSSRAQSEYTQPPHSVRQGTIARATVDTTLAVIPAEAFRRLTQKFPKASAHIVQGMSYKPAPFDIARLTIWDL